MMLKDKFAFLKKELQSKGGGYSDTEIAGIPLRRTGASNAGCTMRMLRSGIGNDSTC